jgi:uridine kinase
MEFHIGQKTPEIFVLGVGGGSASGKTSFVSRLMQKFAELQSTTRIQVISVSLDSHYKPLPDGVSALKYNFDEASALDIKEAAKMIKKFCKGEEVTFPHYDFSLNARTNHGPRFELNVFADKVIFIIEGIHVFAPELLQILNMKLWIHTAEDIRLQRRIVRDINERGRTERFVRTQWDTTTQQTFLHYEGAYRATADRELSNDEPISDSVITSFAEELIAVPFGNCYFFIALLRFS